MGWKTVRHDQILAKGKHGLISYLTRFHMYNTMS